MTVQFSTSRQAGDKLVITQAQRQVQTFFDGIKNGTQNYRTIASLDAQIAQAYRGRCILELLQNAHDALKAAPSADLRQVSFVLNTSSRPVLLIGGSWNNMVDRIRSRSSEPRPRNVFGAEQLAFMSGMLHKAVRFREAHPELEHRWVDVNYFDLIQSPLAVVRNIHDRFDWTLEQAAVDAMEDWQLRQAEIRRGETRHRYDLQDFGLTPQDVDGAFAPYRDFVTARGIRESRL